MSAAITAAVIVAGSAAYAANQKKKSAAQANKAASKPTVTQPWDAAMPYLTSALGDNKSMYDQVVSNYMSRFSGAGAPTGTGATGGDVAAAAGAVSGLTSRQTRRAARRSRREGAEGGGDAQSAARPKRGPLPDSMVGRGFFQTQADDLFDPSRLDPASDPTLQPYIDALKGEYQEDLDRQLLDIDEQSNSIGMYGGSGRALEASRTREEGSEALANQLAQVYLGQRQSALDRQMQGLGLISERDIAAGSQAVQLKGIRSAAQTARRGQNMASSQFNSTQARQDTLMPMSIYGDYLQGLGVLTNLGPSTRTGPYQYTDPGPGAWAAGLSSLGGSMMGIFGAGGMNAAQPATVRD